MIFLKRSNGRGSYFVAVGWGWGETQAFSLSEMQTNVPFFRFVSGLFRIVLIFFFKMNSVLK
jgi:hypothetical protein